MNTSVRRTAQRDNCLRKINSVYAAAVSIQHHRRWQQERIHRTSERGSVVVVPVVQSKPRSEEELRSTSKSVVHALGSLRRPHSNVRIWSSQTTPRERPASRSTRALPVRLRNVFGRPSAPCQRPLVSLATTSYSQRGMLNLSASSYSQRGDVDTIVHRRRSFAIPLPCSLLSRLKREIGDAMSPWNTRGAARARESCPP